MTTPDIPPSTPTPEQLDPFDRAITNMQTVLDSSIRTRHPEDERYGEGMTRSITFGMYGASEHVGEDGQTRYRARSISSDLVWVFDPDTRTVHAGKEDPSLKLELIDTAEVPDASYSILTDQLPQLLAEAKQVGYPQSRTAAALGWLATLGRHRKPSQ